MYCKKHEDEGNKPFRTNFNLEEYRRVMEASEKITCPICKKEFLSNPKFKDMTVEQFLEL